jgi:hypothetical protein
MFIPSTFLQSVHSETYHASQPASQRAIDAMDPPSTPLSSSSQWKTQIQKAKKENTRSSSVSKQNKTEQINKQTTMLLCTCGDHAKCKTSTNFAADFLP